MRPIGSPWARSLSAALLNANARFDLTDFVCSECGGEILRSPPPALGHHQSRNLDRQSFFIRDWGKPCFTGGQFEAHPRHPFLLHRPGWSLSPVQAQAEFTAVSVQLGDLDASP